MVKLYIPKGNKRILWMMILYVIIYGLLISFLGFPSNISYLLDLLNIWLLFNIMSNIRTKIKTKELKIILLFITLFFAYTLLTVIINAGSIIRFLWAVRNNFRFYVFFIGCVLFLNKETIEKLCDLWLKLELINTGICVVQYFGFGIRQDNLGGFFGIRMGCNGYLNIFMIIAAIIALVYYIEKKISITYCSAVLLSTMFVAALAELKFFYIEMIVVVILLVLTLKFSWRKVLIVTMGFFAIFIGIQILIKVYPFFADVFRIQNLLKYANSDTGYTSSGDLNRLGWSIRINRNYLTSFWKQLLGLGFGSCEYSDSFSLLMSTFFLKNKWIHYTWLSNVWWYLETGWIGVAFFNGFFCVCGYKALAYKKNSHIKTEQSLYLIAFLVSVICILIAIYNSSLRTEAGYMIYFFIAIPFVIKNNH